MDRFRKLIYWLAIFGFLNQSSNLACGQDDTVQGSLESNKSAQTVLDEASSDQAKAEQVDPIIAMNLAAKAFRAAAHKIGPSLVTIESYGGVGAKEGRIGGIRKQGEGNTTGVMISPDGYILTSTFNFIQEPPVITVITSDGKRHFAKLMGRDDTRKNLHAKNRKRQQHGSTGNDFPGQDFSGFLGTFDGRWLR